MKWIPSIAATALFLASACSGGGSGATTGGGGGGGPTVLTLEATDAPFVFDIVSEARISIDKITLLPGTGDDGPIILTGEPGRARPARPERCARALAARRARGRLPAAQSASSGAPRPHERQRHDRGRTIHLSSQDTSGFGLVDPPIAVAEGEHASALLDFDMTHTFPRSRRTIPCPRTT
jgi:hypothetical protein